MAWVSSTSAKLHILSCVVGIVLGLSAHHGLFIHGEWHVQAPQIFLSHLFLFSFTALGTAWFHGSAEGNLLLVAFLTSIWYLLALLASITSYRIWFHALTRAGFKGPWYMRVSKLYHVWCCRTPRNHILLDELNKEYGDFVRTGPAEITIFHPDVFNSTDGPGSTCGKSSWYDLLLPESSLLTTRDRKLHDARRRDWKVGFSPQALAHYFTATIRHVGNLEKAIEADARANRPTEMRNLFYWLGFDVMGTFVFNRSFDMLINQNWHHIVVRLQRALSLLGLVSPAPWLIQIAFRSAPRIFHIRDWFKMSAWTHDQVGARLEAGFDKQEQPDLVHYLIELKNAPRSSETVLRMRGDSLNAIVAGSHPIPAVLMGMFSELAQKPHYIDAIYQEVASADVTDTKALSQMVLLNAVIQESLRLYPVLPTGAPRQTGKDGILVAGVYIPPHTTIISPRFSIQRREDCFEKANDFIPERWTTRREMVRNIAAYNPWGTAHHSCIARVMATDMLRITTFQLIKKYHFELAPGDDGKRVLGEMLDQLAPNPGPLSLCFRMR